jgi:hypothetical protein
MFQLYHGENKFIFNEMMMRSALSSTASLLDAMHRIGGVMVNVLASSGVYRGFNPRSGQTNFVFINDDVIVDFPTFQADDMTKVEPTKVHLVSYICVI